MVLGRFGFGGLLVWSSVRCWWWVALVPMVNKAQQESQASKGLQVRRGLRVPMVNKDLRVRRGLRVRADRLMVRHVRLLGALSARWCRVSTPTVCWPLTA